jgi:hypothetical protein
VSSISSNGFTVNTAHTNGRMLGNGVYFADNQGQAVRYGKVLAVRINVSNPHVTTTLGWMKTYGQITRLAKREGVFSTLTPVERINWWAKRNGFDAIRVTDGLRQTVVFDPKNVVVVKD